MKVNTFDNENIFDLSLRFYGNVNGIDEIIPQLVDNQLPKVIELNQKIFSKFIEPEQPNTKQSNISATGIEDQSIFDIALQLGGSLNELNKVISNYESINENSLGKNFNIIRKQDARLNEIIRKSLKFATKDKEIGLDNNWILANGTWNDGGIWIDTEIWIDN